jgi:formyl-CoA transferase
VADPQFQALGSLVRVPDPELGSVLMQNVIFRLSETPGRIASAGPALGQHTEEVLAEIGIDADQVAELRRQGAV